MPLACKPDFERAKAMWEHYWNGEVMKRPLVLVECRKSNAPPPRGPANPQIGRYWRHCHGRMDEELEIIDRRLEQIEYLGEAMPAFGPDLGPDQFAAFLGCDLHFSPDSRETNWVEPIVDDWDAFGPIRFDPNNAYWQRLLDNTRRLARHGEGRYLARHIDKHSHADALSAMRGPQRFCMDFIERPEAVERAMAEARAFYAPLYDAVFEAGNMGGANGSTQIVWSPGKAAILQCDMQIMLGPEHFRRFILPAIEEEAAFVDHSIFHLDGVGAFRFLDDLLAIRDLDMIQLTPGAGEAPNHTFVELFKKILAAGKGIQVSGAGLTPDRVKQLHRELGPKGPMYMPQCRTREEAEELLEWLERNT
ncbi:MAG: hypothetical protein BWZ10_02363 [candidate division BRC1 bacterium ADurb.BinA364]|nr:MAG: hypothetical protein BWZ10_02363 [candidate division BRC1 bacterium ADurb.BinA364]